MNSSLSLRFFLLLLLTGILGCSKPDQQEPEKPDQEEPENPGKDTVLLPSGSLYIDCGTMFRKINVADSSLNWETYDINLKGKSGCAMVLDETLLYSASTNGVLALIAETGQARWFVLWNNYTTFVPAYRESVANETYVLFASSTNGLIFSTLYCLNKHQGSLLWTKQVDNSNDYSGFTTTPVLAKDKVILVTRDSNRHKHLTAYQISDGSVLWSTSVDDNLPTRLRAVNDLVYSTAGEAVICYDANDGSIKWQQNQLGDDFLRTATFFENDRLILVRISENSYNIYTLNTADGTVISQTSLPAASIDRSKDVASGCAYRNNKLVVVSRYGYSSINLRFYDLTSKTMVWERDLEHNIGSYDYDIPTPLLTNNYVIVPTNDTYIGGPALVYFINFQGKDIIKIPFVADFQLTNFAYEENGVFYNQDHRMIRR